MNDLLELAKVIQENAEAEADAIKDYTALLQLLDKTSIPEEDRDFIRENINEIISDELNHQTRLKALYTMLTGIEENKN